MIGTIILIIQEKNPLETFSLMFRLSLGSVNSFTSSLNKAVPLILAGLGISIINSVKFWNIGAEGQIFFGAIAVNYIYINTQVTNSTMLIFVLLISGFVGGAICILIPAITKVFFGVNEIITTLLTNYIAIGITIYLINGPWKDPGSLNFPAAEYIGEEVYLPTIFGKLSFGFIVCITFTVIAFYLKNKSIFGYELRIAGGSELTAIYAGINAKQKTFIAMLIGGGFAGLAGGIELLGQTHRLSTGISQGFGYTAIIVAAITGMRPIGIFLVGCLFGALSIGGSVIQTVGVSTYIADIIQASTLMGALISQFFFNYEIKRKENA
ncbi:ABC transporter permease [Acidimicrobiaceae bacterium]|nr:ABC transporter permease [Acidimicrobiaceae bacterium]